jgi:hypothetical protein
MGTAKREDNLNTQKLVPIVRFGWSALVAWTGIAKTNTDRDVGDWLAETLQGIGRDASFEELPRRLKTADQWRRKCPHCQDLTFSVVGFVGRKPVALVVSNFTNFNGPLTRRSQNLEVDRRKPTDSEVFVLGDLTGVSNDSKLLLRRALLNADTPARVHATMAAVNAVASERSTSGTISKECVTGHLLPSGAGEVIPHWIPADARYVPGFVARFMAASGIKSLTPKTDESGNLLPPRWNGAAFKYQQLGNLRGTATVHSFANVAGSAVDAIPPKTFVFDRIAGENEPRTMTCVVDGTPISVTFSEPTPPYDG